MPVELQAVKTPVKVEELALALCDAYSFYFGSWPSKDSIRVLLAQWALETGWGKSMWCYNLGNVKSHSDDGYDFCYFACNEVLPTKYAKRLQSKNPKTVRITRDRGDETSVVWFYPKHPACRFRAFKSLEDGAKDYIRTITANFGKAWRYVVEGKPAAFSRALKKLHYYTADEASYTATLEAVFSKLDYLSLPKPPVFRPEERQAVLNQIAAALDQDIRRKLHGGGSTEEDGS